MSDITSRPYNPLMACERCAFGRGVHAHWCEFSLYGHLPAPATHCGMTVYVSNGQERNRISFISQRRKHEPEEEWAKRCAVITNVKEPE